MVCSSLILCSLLVVLACFLSAADYASVLSDFVFAVCGFTEAGFAVLVRIEGHGNGGLVLIGAEVVFLVLLRVLEKHFFVFLSSLFPCSLFFIICRGLLDFVYMISCS